MGKITAEEFIGTCPSMHQILSVDENLQRIRDAGRIGDSLAVIGKLCESETIEVDSEVAKAFIGNVVEGLEKKKKTLIGKLFIDVSTFEQLKQSCGWGVALVKRVQNLEGG